MKLVDAEEILMKIGENLKNVREMKGLSLRELAAKCNSDHSDIAKIEKGQKNVTIETLVQLAIALEVHPKKIFDFERPAQTLKNKAGEKED